jgi:anti-sigma regulatory factor (Ser/Thr protein kinase)
MSGPDPPLHDVVRFDPSRAPTVIDVELTFDIDGLHMLRATLAAHTSSIGTPAIQIEHLLIVASELATNAIRHGGGRGHLRLWHHDQVLYCQVRDEGPGFSDPAAGTSPPNPADGNGGRGLWICRQLADVVIDAGPGGRGATVTAVLAPDRT